MRTTFCAALLAIASLGAVPPAQLKPRLAASPNSPVLLGTQVTLAVIEPQSKLAMGESLFYSFAAQRSGEELQLIRRFEKEANAKWTPSRAGTYAIVATIELRRGEKQVVSQSTATATYVVTAPSSSSSSSSSNCRPGLAKTPQGLCVDLKTDPLNCGAVGNRCSSGQPVCKDSKCVLRDACGAPLLACQEADLVSCVDPTKDPLNCGTCGNRCADNQNCVDSYCRAAQ